MNRDNKSVDGLVRRPSTAKRRTINADDFNSKPRAKVVAKPAKPVRPAPKKHHEALSSADLDEVLKNLPSQEEAKPKKRKVKRVNKAKQGGKKRKIIKRTVLALALVLLLGVGYFVYRFIQMGNSVFDGGIVSLVQKERLKEDANGRTNVLIFGTEEEDHPGADLTDSIMVLSINQTTKDAYMISLPRDLYVGTCTSTGKLNEIFWCTYMDDETQRRAGAEALRDQASEILGLDIQYWVHVNWEVLRTAVDAVGGVTVTIETDDPRGIFDPNFDWACPNGPYTCQFVRYAQGEVVHLDGVHALALARARNAQGGFGLAGGNFDRELNQQKILSALQEAAMSAGTLANPAKVLGLMESLGSNLTTNFHMSEVRTLVDLGREIRNDNIISVPLLDPENGVNLLRTGMVGAASVVMPTAGIGNYTDIQAHVRRVLSSNPVDRENASIEVMNGSDIAGLGSLEATNLEDAGFNILSVSNAPENVGNQIVIYQLNGVMSATAEALANRFGVSVQTAVPANIVSDADFVVIFGRASE